MMDDPSTKEGRALLRAVYAKLPRWADLIRVLDALDSAHARIERLEARLSVKREGWSDEAKAAVDAIEQEHDIGIVSDEHCARWVDRCERLEQRVKRLEAEVTEDEAALTMNTLMRACDMRLTLTRFLEGRKGA